MIPPPPRSEYHVGTNRTEIGEKNCTVGRVMVWGSGRASVDPVDLDVRTAKKMGEVTGTSHSAFGLHKLKVPSSVILHNSHWAYLVEDGLVSRKTAHL